MQEDIRIRAGSPDDAAAIVELGQREFGREDVPSVAAVTREMATWTERKAPIIVARDGAGTFLGYAYCKPNQEGLTMRPAGQVAVLTHVAVTESARGKGVGTALVQRATKTLRMLGFTTIHAQMQESVGPWYQALGWTVHQPGEVKAWVEPHIAQDDQWHEDLPPGSFSPILIVALLERYPCLAELHVKEERPILDVVFAAKGDYEKTAETGGRALAAKIAADLTIVRRVPPALALMLAEQSGIEPIARDALRAYADEYFD